MLCERPGYVDKHATVVCEKSSIERSDAEERVGHART
jgi:hypothetical protein